MLATVISVHGAYAPGMNGDRAKDSHTQEVRIGIAGASDIVKARAAARGLAEEVNFSSAEVIRIVAAAAEMARNMIEHAGRGEMILSVIAAEGRLGVQVIAHDCGPGIADVERALETGLGLGGSRRLMDEFEVSSIAGAGTTVTMKKWVRATEGQVER